MDRSLNCLYGSLGLYQRQSHLTVNGERHRNSSCFANYTAHEMWFSYIYIRIIFYLVTVTTAALAE